MYSNPKENGNKSIFCNALNDLKFIIWHTTLRGFGTFCKTQNTIIFIHSRGSCRGKKKN